MTSPNVVEEVVVVQEECGDEYILPEYTMSTPSTNSTPERRSSLPQNTRATREKILDQLRTALITRVTWTTSSFTTYLIYKHWEHFLSVKLTTENTTSSSNQFTSAGDCAHTEPFFARLPSSQWMVHRWHVMRSGTFWICAPNYYNREKVTERGDERVSLEKGKRVVMVFKHFN